MKTFFTFAKCASCLLFVLFVALVSTPLMLANFLRPNMLLAAPTVNAKTTNDLIDSQPGTQIHHENS